MTVIDIPEDFHDIDGWLAELATEEAAAARSEESAVYARQAPW